MSSLLWKLGALRRLQPLDSVHSKRFALTELTCDSSTSPVPSMSLCSLRCSSRKQIELSTVSYSILTTPSKAACFSSGFSNR